jgi:hypothetical protein
VAKEKLELMQTPINYNFYYWGPYLWRSSISDDMCDQILAKGLKSTNDYRQYLASLIDDVRAFDSTDSPFLLEALSPYLETYLETKKQFAPESTTPKLELIEFWINFQKSGEFNPEHIHSGDLSFVVYLDIPDNLIEENNNYKGTGAGPGNVVFRYGEQSNWAVSLQNFVPKKGDIFIFPASLSHSAYPFYSSGVRVSMSGNFKFVYE